MHELFRPFPACQDQRKWTAFPSQANSYFEEGAAELFLNSPFADKIERLAVRRKIERISVLEFPDAGPELAEHRTQFIEVAFPLRRRKRLRNAGERRFLLCLLIPVPRW